MDQVDGIVVGAGVVGLAVARALAMTGRGVIIIDTERHIGAGISSRNSEVIHAGLYYPQGSLKARLCVEGKQQLYAFCEARGVPHRRCGKLVVATEPDQLGELERFVALAGAAGVHDLALLNAAEAVRMEPALRCSAALLSPSTGIVDSHAYMLALQGEAEAHGALSALGARLTAVEPHGSRLRLYVDGETAPAIEARLLVNAAGLGAQALAHSIAGMPEAAIPPLHMAKGHYFALAGRAPFGRLVYPMPHSGGLGVHLTLDMAGQARFGPDVEWVDRLNYDVDPSRADVFYEAVRRYWPGLADGALQPAYAGIRPKLSGPGEPAADFVIQDAGEHGIPGLVNLFGIESPGLTASLAIAELVKNRIEAMAEL
jgi:L-2-hydroxyglutarate oxidase LhgO